jgi:subtilisin family serine protease
MRNPRQLPPNLLCRNARCLTGLLLLLATVPLAAQDDKLAPDLTNLADDQTIDVIIQLQEPAARPGARRQPTAFTPPAGVNLSAHRPVSELGIIGALSARVGRAALASLAADPRVKYISPDREISASMDSARPAVLANVAQDSGFTGKGVGIAVVDSGIWPKPDFLDENCQTSRIVHNESFVTTEPATRTQDA